MNSSQNEINFPTTGWRQVIIAMKGLPSTGKSVISRLISHQTRSPMVSIDDFLRVLSLDKGYTTNNLSPSREEADRLHDLSFEALCTVASDHIDYGSKCVVVKSRLSSSFELDMLIKLVKERGFSLIIVECRMKNEYRHQLLFDERRQQDQWYKPISWMDVRKAKEEHESLYRDWDLRLLDHLVDWEKPEFSPPVTRLVLDSFDDLDLCKFTDELAPDFVDVIKYLLFDPHRYVDESRYKVVQFDELRRFLFTKRAGATNKYLCSSTTSKAGSCVFKYFQKLSSHYDSDDDYEDEDNLRRCGVCQEEADDQPGYTCRFCFLTLHKSCAEHIDPDLPEHIHDPLHVTSYPYHYELSRLERNYACKSCKESGNYFDSECNTCLFETHLKWGLVPTIINHDCHEHFLSLQLGADRAHT